MLSLRIIRSENYAMAVDEVLAICQRELRSLSRSLVFEYRASMLNRGLSAVSRCTQMPENALLGPVGGRFSPNSLASQSHNGIHSASSSSWQ
jgi:hypothetical protein